MKKIFSFISILCVASIFTACYTDPRTLDPAAPLARSGTANFTRYVAIGNSLTAGFADGGLYNASIATSYPNILAGQFRLAGGGAFIQPTFTANASDGSGYRKMVGFSTNPAVVPTLIRTFDPTNPDAACGRFAIVGQSLYNPGNGAQPLFEKYVGLPINNFGVPGIRVNQINVASFGRNRAFNPAGGDVFFNPYYERMLTSANETQSYIDFVTAQSANATFFTNWLGNNDVLGYATAGAPSGAALNAFNNMTDVATFTTNYQAMMTALLANGRKGVVVTIPYVNRAPFFTTVTLAALQAAVQQGGGPANASIFIEAQSGTRAATANDLFLLSSQGNYALLGRTNVGAGQPFPYGLHPNNPLTDANVLDSDEVADITARTDAFNAVITAYASNPNVAVVNINTAVLDALVSPAGFFSGGIVYRGTFIQGGAFSLDGIHLTPAGYAVVANEIIKATNAKFGSAIPLVSTAQFSTVKFFTSLCQAP